LGFGQLDLKAAGWANQGDVLLPSSTTVKALKGKAMAIYLFFSPSRFSTSSNLCSSADQASPLQCTVLYAFTASAPL